MKAFPTFAGLILAAALVSPAFTPALAQGAAKEAATPATPAKEAAKPATPAKEAAKPATPASEAVRPVKVNGKPIPKARVDFMVKSQTAQGQPDTLQMREAVIDRLINVEVVVQEAERKGMSKSPEVQSQIDMARQQIIFQAYLQDFLKRNPIKDEAMRAEYNKVKAQRGEREYKARHILVEKEAEAKDIIEQLKKGGKFEELAKQSKDMGSKERGGELDWQPAATYVKPFGDALAKLEKGKTTESPVQTQFGYHVIRLDDVRAAQFPEFDAVKQQIMQMLQNQEVERAVKELRAKAKID